MLERPRGRRARRGRRTTVPGVATPDPPDADELPRHVKIIATIGPASHDVATLTAMIGAGMDAARINCSHTPAERIPELVAAVRAAETAAGRHIAVLGDLAGPKLRIDGLDGPVELAAGDAVRIGAADAVRPPVAADRAAGIWFRVPAPELIASCAVGDTVLLADGEVSVEVRAVEADQLRGVVTTPGAIGPRKGVHVPGIDLAGSAITEADRQSIAVGLEAGVDVFAVSFVQHPSDIATARALIGERALIIAKIERASAVDELDGILELADGMMVARGDLGVELPLEEVPGIQKDLVYRSLMERKIPVVATEMLESMITSARPTRAEVSDVANAALDGASAVMLSAETAMGAHPVATVATMDRILRRVEHHRRYAGSLLATQAARFASSPVDAPLIDSTSWGAPLADAATELAPRVGAAAIVLITETGRTARLLAAARPECPIVAACFSETVVRRLCLSWGVVPVIIEAEGSRSDLRHRAAAAAGRVLGGDGGVVVVLSGPVGDHLRFDDLRIMLVDGRGAVVPHA